MDGFEQTLVTQATVGVDVGRRTIYISGFIDTAMAHRVLLALISLDSVEGEIKIILNSEGGNEQDGYAIYDAITHCRNKVHIYGYGSVMSIAAAIFQAGDKRMLAPHASFMIHNGTGPSSEDMKQTDIVELAEQLKRDNQKYYEILAKSSGQTVETIQEWCRQDTYFDAAEAVEHGFADEIIAPQKVYGKKRKRRKKNVEQG